MDSNILSKGMVAIMIAIKPMRRNSPGGEIVRCMCVDTYTHCVPSASTT